MLKEYIDSLRQKGQASFTSEEAQKALGISKAGLAMAISRLRKKGALVSPYRDFYVPLPPEHRNLGCLPAEQLIPLLMKHIKTDYYLCLLSAAAIHGAAHQRPQVSQVMVSKRIRNIKCGHVAINFIYKKSLSDIPTQLFTVPTGYLKLSSPEATAMDLLLYPSQAGGINHIATVLTELMEIIDPQKLLALAQSSKENAWVQRLGYILEHIDIEEPNAKVECIKILKEYIQKSDPSYIPLVPGNVKAALWNKDWRVIVNREIESDL